MRIPSGVYEESGLLRYDAVLSPLKVEAARSSEIQATI